MNKALRDDELAKAHTRSKGGSPGEGRGSEHGGVSGGLGCTDGTPDDHDGAESAFVARGISGGEAEKRRRVERICGGRSLFRVVHVPRPGAEAGAVVVSPTVMES